MIRHLLEKLLSSELLTELETEQVFAHMLAGELVDAEIAAVLAAWRLRGETTVELCSGAKALRKTATKVAIPLSARPLVDNCGTGGDGSHSFNLSTAAAIVASAAGAHVAKHGNRSISSKCGSADLLFAAGFPVALKVEAAGELLAATGFTFFFAPNYHAAMRHVAPVRKQLGVRTIFNLLGPLANPIAPEFQLIGVGAMRYLRPIAETLLTLGIKTGLVLHSRDGLDELSPEAPTDALLIKNGAISELTITPGDHGIKARLGDIIGGDPTFNLNLLRRILAGEASGLTEAVVLNAGAVLWVADICNSLSDGIALARKQLREKRAQHHFDAWIACAKALDR